jgi:hypothetical protein
LPKRTVQLYMYYSVSGIQGKPIISTPQKRKFEGRILCFRPRGVEKGSKELRWAVGSQEVRACKLIQCRMG